MKKALIRVLTGLLAVIFLYLILLIHPDPLFRNKFEYKNFIIHSDALIQENIEVVIDDAIQRIKHSELYESDDKFKLYLCNSDLLFTFFTRNGNAGGVVNYVISGNIFIRQSNIEKNQLIPPKSWVNPLNERTLSYFIAHESVHSLQRKFDRFLVLNAPVEIMEGYADYVAKQPKNNLDSLIRNYKRNVSSMDPKNGLYDKYNLYVSFLFEKKGFDFYKLIEEMPDLEKTLEEIRE